MLHPWNRFGKSPFIRVFERFRVNGGFFERKMHWCLLPTIISWLIVCTNQAQIFLGSEEHNNFKTQQIPVLSLALWNLGRLKKIFHVLTELSQTLLCRRNAKCIEVKLRSAVFTVTNDFSEVKILSIGNSNLAPPNLLMSHLIGRTP